MFVFLFLDFKSLCRTVSRSIHVSANMFLKTVIQKNFMIKRSFYVERGKIQTLFFTGQGWRGNARKIPLLCYSYFKSHSGIPFSSISEFELTLSPIIFHPEYTVTLVLFQLSLDCIFLLVQGLLSYHSPIC